MSSSSRCDGSCSVTRAPTSAEGNNFHDKKLSREAFSLSSAILFAVQSTNCYSIHFVHEQFASAIFTHHLFSHLKDEIFLSSTWNTQVKKYLIHILQENITQKYADIYIYIFHSNNFSLLCSTFTQNCSAWFVIVNFDEVFFNVNHTSEKSHIPDMEFKVPQKT